VITSRRQGDLAHTGHGRRTRGRPAIATRTCSDPQACCPSWRGPGGWTPGACGSGGCSGFAGSCRRTGLP